MFRYDVLGSWRRGFGLLVLSVAILLARYTQAAEEYPAPGYFLEGLTAESSWKDIQSKPDIKAELPEIAFGSTFVSLGSVCVDGSTLAIADPRIDNGVRVSADELRAQVQTARAANPQLTEPMVQVAGGAPSETGEPPQVAMYYPANVSIEGGRRPDVAPTRSGTGASCPAGL
jgi:hypothetical protein